MPNNTWYLLLLIAPFAKGCVYPGWSSAVEFALCCGLVALLTIFRPREPLDELKLREIRSQIAGVHEELKGFKLRLGLRPER